MLFWSASVSGGRHSKLTSLLLACTMELAWFTEIVPSFSFMLIIFAGLFVVWKCNAWVGDFLSNPTTFVNLVGEV